MSELTKEQKLIIEWLGLDEDDIHMPITIAGSYFAINSRGMLKLAKQCYRDQEKPK